MHANRGAVSTVYLIAGWSFTVDMWARWLDGIAASKAANIRWVPLDAPAFLRWMTGASSLSPEGAPWDDGGYAALGWSLGGHLLAESLARGRWRPASAVVVAASPRFLSDPAMGWPGVSAAELQALRRRIQKSPSTALAQFDAWLGLAVTDLLRERDAAVLCDGLDWLARLDHRACVQDLPLRWLCGDADPLVPDPACLPQGAIVIPNAGHGLPFTHQDHLLQALAIVHDRPRID